MNGRTRRVWLETALAAAAGVAGLLTLLWPAWIEAVFGVDPDHGNGSLEWIVAFGLLGVSLGLSLAARREVRRRLAAGAISDG